MVWVWGENKKGELGLRDNIPRENPYPLASLKGKPVSSLSLGYQFSIALGQTKKLNRQASVSPLHD